MIKLNKPISNEDARAISTATLSSGGLVFLTPGQMVPGKGIFTSLWAPTDKSGNKIGPVFNLFAAPEDLTTEKNNSCSSHSALEQHLSGLSNWHGHNGCNFYTDKSCIEGVLSDGYQGEWFIPTLEMAQSIFNNKDKGAFKNTLKDKYNSAASNEYIYWSCSPSDRTESERKIIRMSDGHVGANLTGILVISCRPVRVEMRL